MTAFSKESYSEWFNTKTDLINFYSKRENFDRISRGEFGKLNYKYTYRVLLECKEDFDLYLFDVAEKMLREKKSFNNNCREQLNDLLKYAQTVYLDFSKGLTNIPVIKKDVFNYNVIRWKKEGYNKDLSEYVCENKEIIFEITNSHKEKLEMMHKFYSGTNLNQTLRKMSEYINAEDLFYEARD